MSPTTSAPANRLGEPSDDEEQLGKRERNKLDKQRRIVEAATELFQQKGFDDTTTAEIAEKAGIGAGTLYLYVGSKEDLLVSVFEVVAGDAWSGAFERLDPTSPLLDQMTDLFLHVTEYHEADQRLAKSFFKELPWVEPTGRPRPDAFVVDFLRRIEHLLLDASKSGQIHPDVARQRLASNLYAIWVQEMRRHIGGRQSYDEMISEMTEAFRVALWGMTPETS